MERQTKAKRKLVGRFTLIELHQQVYKLGVPLVRACKNLKLDVSRPVIANLLYYYDFYEQTKLETFNCDVINSLFPPWLDNYDLVKENPDEWAYKGRFPNGEWVELTDE